MPQSSAGLRSRRSSPLRGPGASRWRPLHELRGACAGKGDLKAREQSQIIVAHRPASQQRQSSHTLWIQRSPSHWTVVRLAQNAHDFRDWRMPRSQRIVSLSASSSSATNEVVASCGANSLAHGATVFSACRDRRVGPFDRRPGHPQDAGSLDLRLAGSEHPASFGQP